MSDDLFDLLDLHTYDNTTTDVAYCPACNLLMVLVESEYNCTQCGRVQKEMCEWNGDRDDMENGYVKLSLGGTTHRYTISQNTHHTQKKAISDQLRECQRLSSVQIPIEVLNAVTETYNMIQRHVKSDDKKFVHRGTIKDETLAALIKFECISRHITRKNRDIAKFMRLPTDGFSRGESLLRSLQSQKHIVLPDDDPTDGYIDRYSTNFKLTEDHRAFVVELLNIVDDLNIGLSSQPASKVAGAIWLLVQRVTKMDDNAFELLVDGTKKNTFKKFAHEIERLIYLEPIRQCFENFMIPLRPL